MLIPENTILQQEYDVRLGRRCPLGMKCHALVKEHVPANFASKMSHEPTHKMHASEPTEQRKKNTFYEPGKCW